MSLLQLPYELLGIISDSLTTDSLLSFTSICKKLHQEYFWSKHYKKLYGNNKIIEWHNWKYNCIIQEHPVVYKVCDGKFYIKARLHHHRTDIFPLGFVIDREGRVYDCRKGIDEQLDTSSYPYLHFPTDREPMVPIRQIISNEKESFLHIVTKNGKYFIRHGPDYENRTEYFLRAEEVRQIHSYNNEAIVEYFDGSIRFLNDERRFLGKRISKIVWCINFSYVILTSDGEVYEYRRNMDHNSLRKTNISNIKDIVSGMVDIVFLTMDNKLYSHTTKKYITFSHSSVIKSIHGHPDGLYIITEDMSIYYLHKLLGYYSISKLPFKVTKFADSINREKYVIAYNLFKHIDICNMEQYTEGDLRTICHELGLSDSGDMISNIRSYIEINLPRPDVTHILLP
jgi:hypothetical protein